MTHDEATQRLQLIAGINRSGWQQAAAEKMGMTARGVRKALSGDRISPVFERKIVAALSGVTPESSDDTVESRAGAWIVGEPVTKSRRAEVVGECVVTHLRAPRFVLHVEMIRGKQFDGHSSPVFEKRVHWIDNSTPKASDKLARAGQIAEDRIYQASRLSGEAQAREKMISDQMAREHDSDASEAVRSLREAELRASSTAALVADKRMAGAGTDADADVRDIEKEISEIYRSRASLTEAEGRIFESGRRMGFLDMLMRVLSLVSAHAGTDVAEIAASRMLTVAKAARRDTLRGDTSDD